MIDQETRQTITFLHNKQKSHREIVKILKVSRNTVKSVLKEGVTLKTRKEEETDMYPLLRELFPRCLKNAVRIKEVLEEEYGIQIGYTTLKRYIRDAGLRDPLHRVGEYVFNPGHEMQHDTSPHWVYVGGKRIKLQCASLVYGYSRKLFTRYYPCFTRFEAKTFLKAAIEFMGGSCSRCIIDNTSVILSGGSGSNAVVSKEMQIFSGLYGFEFEAHRVNDPNRKAKIERPFRYIETNFLAGRSFKDIEDLNQQAKEWGLKVNQKEKRLLKMSPNTAFIQEKRYLVPLPEVEPPIYEHYQRLVDCQGYVNLDTNRYSAPEKLIRKKVDVYKYEAMVKIFYHHREMAVHPRLLGKRYERSTLSGHHHRQHNVKKAAEANTTEIALKGHSDLLDQYVRVLKQRKQGYRYLNRLLTLKRTYPAQAFVSALEKAAHYGLYDLNRLEDLIIKSVAGDYFNLKEEE